MGISVPLFNRNQGNIASAEANVRRSRAELARFELQLGQLFGSVYEDYLTSIRTADVYRTEILPRAERAYELYLMKFKEVSAAYPQVLIAQRTLIQSTESYLAALERVTRSAVALRNSLLMDGLEAPEDRGGRDAVSHTAGRFRGWSRAGNSGLDSHAGELTFLQEDSP